MRLAAETADQVVTVGAGVFETARSGLLEGRTAVVSPEFSDRFSKEFPGIDLHKDVSSVDSGPVSTAVDLAAGVRMALHIVRRYYGTEIAKNTARRIGLEISGEI